MKTRQPGFFEAYEHRIELKAILEDLSKKELEVLCKRHHIRGYSYWNKNEMIGHLFNHILTPSVMYRFFLCVNDEEIADVRLSEDSGGIIEDAEPEKFSFLMLGGYAGFTRNMDFGIPFEVLEVFSSFDDAQFEEKRRRIIQIGDYSHLANHLYGVTPPMQVVKIFNSYERKKTDWREVMDVYEIIREYRCEFVYKNNYFVDRPFMESYEELLELQGNIPYYMPGREYIEEWRTYGFGEDRTYIMELYRYMTQQLWLNEDKALDICFMLENTIHIGYTIEHVQKELHRLGVDCHTRRQEREFQAILDRLINHTRMIIFRGFTPLEARSLKPTDGMPDE